MYRRSIPSRRQRFPLSRVNAQKEAEAASEARFAEQVSGPALGLEGESEAKAIAEEKKYRHPYWVKFANHKSACVMADHPAAASIVAAELTGSTVVGVNGLPYPAEPVLNAEPGDCPPFCYTPEQCAGNGCCRKSYACSE